MNLHVHIPSYLLGVATVPAGAYLFRKPLIDKFAYVLADDNLDKVLFTFMSVRNDYKDQKKAAKEGS